MADQPERALYLAWRPRTFDAVVGQRHVVQTIRNAVVNGTLAHAYLFAGPRGTGKTSMARLLFKAVNCLRPVEGAPDEQCVICVSANEGRALDLIEMDAASNRGIDDIRDLRDKINYAPGEARYRVYILDEAHQLTQAAWDALLKTLEEPPPHAILVLATTEAHKVPPTVLSRCQRFDFHRISAVEIRERLAEIARHEGIRVEPTVLSWLARAARGGLRDAISLLDQLRAFSGDRIDAESAREVLGLAGLETVRPFLLALEEDRAGDALEELNGAVERGTDLRVYVADAIAYLRALMLLRYGASSSLQADFPAEEIEWLEERKNEWDAARLRRLVGGFGDAMARFRDPSQLQVQIELTLLGEWDASDVAQARPLARPATTGQANFPVIADPAARPPNPPAVLVRANGIDAAPVTAEPTALTDAERSGPSHPPLDPTDVLSRWDGVRDQVASARGQFWFHRCELRAVEADTLVLRLDGGLRSFVEGRDRRMALTRDLEQALGQPIKVRFADEDAPVATAGHAAGQGGTPAPDDDAVIRAGLRLFGGPLESLDPPSQNPAGVSAESLSAAAEAAASPETETSEPPGRQWW